MRNTGQLAITPTATGAEILLAPRINTWNGATLSVNEVLALDLLNVSLLAPSWTTPHPAAANPERRGRADTLIGSEGSDLLYGGAGNDTLWGGAGPDDFVFVGGADRVMDFQNNINTLVLDDALWGNRDLTTARIIDDYARTGNGNTIFDFGNGHSLVIESVTQPDILIDDISVI